MTARIALVLGFALFLVPLGGCSDPEPAPEAAPAVEPIPEPAAEPAAVPDAASGPARILLAAKIVTLEADRPEATAVAVRGDRIVAVGSLEELQAALPDAEVDSTFEGKVLLPGFVDPHVHPSIASIVLTLDILSAVSWQTPSGVTRALPDRASWLAALGERVAQPADDPNELVVVWGYHEPYHGRLSRADLDAVSSVRPIVVSQRSMHEMFFNTRALEVLGYSEADFAKSDQSNWARGHVYEAGLFAVAGSMLQRLMAPERYREGLARMSQVLHRGGLTTVGEQGFPQVNDKLELDLLTAELAKDVPYRFVLVPNAMFLLPRLGSADIAEQAADAMLTRSTERLRFVKHIKYYVDGAMFSQLMQMSEPYLDGHPGQWMMPPEAQRAVLDVFWERGWNIHLHVNGDAGLDTALDMIEQKRKSHPRDDVRVVLEHYGYARPEQAQRVKALGVAVSNNPYYIYELAPPYAEQGLGPERAARLSPLGDLVRAGVRFSFHSDYVMAPAEPLTLVEVAVTRIASDGKVWGPEQRIGLDQALRAITIEGAWSLGLEDEIGSIAPGKKADFTVLEQDPYAVAPEQLAEIPIWGTVFEGKAYPIEAAAP